MRTPLPLLLLLSIPVCATAAPQALRLTSPDGLTYVDISAVGGRATYAAGCRKVLPAKKKATPADTIDVPLLEASPLGLKS
ncbi:MAG: hypothetical protein IJS59_01845, partial [Bacteroidaceae bacterium]|nr:hypothetical protein [Bacteroidaceae bacterium]